MKHVVLVGATDGIGKALALAYLRRGWRVGVVGREPAKTARVAEELRGEVPVGTVATTVCDVRDPLRIGPAFDEIVAALGQMDLFVYCAGSMPPYEGSLEDRVASIGPVLEVNVGGAMRFLEVAADYLVVAGSGRLAAVGSVAGERARKGHPVYGASKAALHQYLEGLRARLHPTGVGVTTIKPGWVRTRLLSAGSASPEAARSPLAIEPERAAELILGGLERGRDSFYVPWWWGVAGLVMRLLPRSLFKRFAPP